MTADDTLSDGGWTITPEVRRIADEIANASDADVLLFNGALYEPYDDQLIVVCRERVKRPNVLLILVTEGGSANVAYRIATTLQENYGRFRVFAPGICTSAGTLVTVGAHELAIGDHGRLGPIDVQMSGGVSGLTIPDALDALNERALEGLSRFYDELTTSGEYPITPDKAVDLAVNLTVGLYAPVYGRIDPLFVGECHRAQTVAFEYGIRLLQSGGNITEEYVEELLGGYSAHDFVINRSEADHLFNSVDKPSEYEASLALELGQAALEEEEYGEDARPFVYLSTEIDDDQE